MSDVMLKFPELIWITGFSQGGTTLLMSLLDGHPDLLVYPDEPAFGKIFKRRSHYLSIKHFLADFIFGTTNPIHLAKEVGTQNPKSKWYPAVSETEYEKIKSILNSKWLASKTLRGINNVEFNEKTFFNNYFRKILDLMENVNEIDPKIAVNLAFKALEYSYPQGRDRNCIYTFKGPLSSVSVEKLDWFRNNFRGLIIFIHRNPYARLYSQILHFRQKGRPHAGPKLNESLIGFLRLCIANAKDYTQSLKISRMENVISIRYEDLVGNCEGTMHSLCAKLQIPFDKVLLRPTKLGYIVKNPTDRTGDDGSVSTTSLFKYKDGLNTIERLTFASTLVFWKLLSVVIK
jgi:hypothetical protein